MSYNYKVTKKKLNEYTNSFIKITNNIEYLEDLKIL